MEQVTDLELMTAVQNGDLQKLGVLYERHNRDLYKYFYRCTLDQGTSEDLVQNVFMRIMKYKHNFRGEGKFVYWLFTMARNVWYDRNRKSDPLKRHESDEQLYDHASPTKTPGGLYEQNERKRILMQALNRLTPEKKEAIVLSRFHGMQYKEIAALADCTENAIKSRIQRGLLELKELINEHEI